MTRPVSGVDLADRIEEAQPGSVVESTEAEVWIEPASVRAVAEFLKDAPDLEFGTLTSISGVDYVEYFEIVYHLTSMTLNRSAVVKTRRYGRAEPEVPSVIEVWRGADLQEREIYDLMGVRFTGHPNMKRILLWEGFEGHPLRKDFLR